jgi:cytochrome c
MAIAGAFRYHAGRFYFPEIIYGASMKIAAIALAAVGLAVTGSALADAGEDLLKKSGCTACHAIDKKIVGPAYVDVAAKYKGDAGSAAKLAEKVKKGGSGVWGPVPMPPNPTVSDADLKTMIAYILALKK